MSIDPPQDHIQKLQQTVDRLSEQWQSVRGNAQASIQQRMRARHAALTLPATHPGDRVPISESVGHAAVTDARLFQAASQLVTASREKSRPPQTSPPPGAARATENHAGQPVAAAEFGQTSRGALGDASAGRPTAELTSSTAGRYDGTMKALSRPRNGGAPLIPGCPACGGAHWLPHNHEGGGVT